MDSREPSQPQKESDSSASSPARRWPGSVEVTDELNLHTEKVLPKETSGGEVAPPVRGLLLSVTAAGIARLQEMERQRIRELGAITDWMRGA